MVIVMRKWLQILGRGTTRTALPIFVSNQHYLTYIPTTRVNTRAHFFGHHFETSVFPISIGVNLFQWRWPLQINPARIGTVREMEM